MKDLESWHEFTSERDEIAAATTRAATGIHNADTIVLLGALLDAILLLTTQVAGLRRDLAQRP